MCVDVKLYCLLQCLDHMIQVSLNDAMGGFILSGQTIYIYFIYISLFYSTFPNDLYYKY